MGLLKKTILYAKPIPFQRENLFLLEKNRNNCLQQVIENRSTNETVRDWFRFKNTHLGSFSCQINKKKVKTCYIYFTHKKTQR